MSRRSERCQDRWDPRQQVSLDAVEEEKRRLASPGYEHRRLKGSVLIGAGAALGVTHWSDHVGAFSLLPPDLAEVGGYATAGILAAWGSLKLLRLSRLRTMNGHPLVTQLHGQPRKAPESATDHRSSPEDADASAAGRSSPR